MSKQKLQNTKPIVCTVKSELQAAQIAKICQDYDIHSIIKIKPVVNISQFKKVLKAKLMERLYEPCPCGKDKKLKFCCYEKTVNLKLYE